MIEPNLESRPARPDPIESVGRSARSLQRALRLTLKHRRHAHRFADDGGTCERCGVAADDPLSLEFCGCRAKGTNPEAYMGFALTPAEQHAAACSRVEAGVAVQAKVDLMFEGKNRGSDELVRRRLEIERAAERGESFFYNL